MRSTVIAKTLCLTVATALALPSVAIAAPPPSGPAGDPASMTPEQKLQMAKQLFGEGNAALSAGDAATALQKFEEAYYSYTPDRHKFNFNIGSAAYETGDCVKARAAFQRFLDLVPDDPNRGDAQVKIMEIDRSGCANAQPTTTTPATTTTTTTPTTSGGFSDDEEDAPVLQGSKQQREDKIERERAAADAKKKSPFLIAGAVLTGVGVLGVVGGAVSLGLANKKANDLANLASPGNTGFPDGDYADDEVFDLDRNKLPRNNVATVVFFCAGGALLISGVALLAVYGKQKKAAKRGGDEARLRKRPQLVGLGPAALPRGGGAAATLRF